MAIKKLCPFKLWTLQNFPFIAEDFDALTNYELMCKIVEYLNNIKDITNEQTTAINTLENWFNNLDVQDEINNKLDEMAESGELEEIISTYLNSNCILAYNTLTDLKNASNIVDGSFARTYGKVTLNDGYGYFYKIREIQNTDVVDEDNIVSINTSNTLIAEKINENIYDIVNELNNNKEDKLTELVILGDSWADPNYDGVNWVNEINKHLNLNIHNYAKSGATFVYNSNNLISSQVTQLQEDTTFDKNKIKYIIVIGGIGDYRYNVDYLSLHTSISTLLNNLTNTYNKAKVLFINDVEYPYTVVQTQYFKKIEELLSASWGGVTLNLDTMMGSALFNSTYFHLTESGYKWLSRDILASLIGGEIVKFADYRVIDNTEFNLVINTERVNNLILQQITFTPKISQTTYEVTQPEIKIPYYINQGQGFVTPFNTTGVFLNRSDKLALTFSSSPILNFPHRFLIGTYIKTP